MLRDSIIFILLTTCLLLNDLFAQPGYDPKYYMPSETDDVLWMPFTGESSAFIRAVFNGKRCYVKVYSYDGVPYSGGVCLKEGVIDSVTYWDVDWLRGWRDDVDTVRIIDHSTLVWVDDSTIAVRGLVPVNMHIISALTGDTVVSNCFPKPRSNIETVKIAERSFTEKTIQRLKRRGYEISGEYATIEVAAEVLFYEYSLPQGLYFAYFVNANDNTLCWVEKINKK